MNQQNPLEAILREQERAIKLSGERRPKQRIRHATALGSESAEFDIIKLQATMPELQNRRRIERISSPIDNRLAHDVAVFPKTNRVVANEYGVFVPRSLLGHNTLIWHEEKRAFDGSIHITISSRPSEKQIKPRRTAKPLDCSLELLWLTEHRDVYAGQWVALDGDKLIASGPDAEEVRQAAQRLGIALPLIVQVEPSDELPFGGW